MFIPKKKETNGSHVNLNGNGINGSAYKPSINGSGLKEKERTSQNNLHGNKI